MAKLKQVRSRISATEEVRYNYRGKGYTGKRPKTPTLAECRRLAWAVGLVFRIEPFGRKRETWHVTTAPRLGMAESIPWVNIGHKKKRAALRMAHAAFMVMAEELP